MRDRRLQSATHFFKFSPVLLRLSLLPGWVFFSLAVNGFLAVILFSLLMRLAPLTPTSSASTQSNSGFVPSAATSPAPGSDVTAESLTLSPRHQLSYGQWVEQLKQEAKIAAEQQPKRLTVLAGDSISLWFPSELLPRDRNWLNQGISGETSAGLLKRLDLFDQTRPESIFVLIGINDLLRDVDDRTLLDRQQQIVSRLKIAHPQAQVVLQSILPHADEQATWEGRDRLLAIPNRRIQELNRQLESIARSEGVYFLDLYPLFADSQGNLRMDFSTDGLHLNSKGYEVWSIALQVYGHEVLEPELK